ncbi:uncharacterized protein LOC126567788 [Anopheles maculipalpis]|uniref:uncharacterized protein LOC126567788 n=1 Tax=Anopheles maculipalpis TaxID=1496333 RepID=UPI00215939A7|nr:uncharacterized protein LOC126567788 [Anopheles maculipalpis]
MPTSLVEGTLFPCTMELPDDEKQQLPSSPKIGDLPEGLVLVSSESDGPDEDEDHEEGEIQDEDEEENQQELEDISSEEESTIRDRMAALEAIDKKVGMMMRKFANHSKYDYLDVEEVMNGKENYCYYYSQHQHPSYRTHKPYKTSNTNKEDSRYTEGSKYTRSVATKRNAEKTKEKGSKRCSHRSRHKRRRYASRSPARHQPSSDSEPEAVVDREYLNLALGIENGKSQRLSSTKNPLKKKLFLQTSKRKRKADVKRKPVVEVSDDSDAVIIEGDADEEEELQLRLLALSTKPIVREAGLGEIISDLQIPSAPPPPTINKPEDRTSDTISAEERELRLIALKTAVLKKHASRQKRRELDNEQPYSPSDDIVLSPVREIPPAYENGAYSDGHDSVEMIEDDDVQIVEPHYEQIDLVDTDDNGNDMEISPVASPIGKVEDMEEDSQQPIDMELASSDSISSAPSPTDGGIAIEQRLLLAGTDSCDSALFHRRGDFAPESPSVTPDSMEEAEAEALRHLLLTKMRQKQSKKREVVEPPSVDGPREQDPIETVPTEDVPVVQDEEEKMLPVREAVPVQKMTSPQPTTNQSSNLITIVDRRVQGKRRKKSLSNSVSLPAKQLASAGNVSPVPELPSELRPQLQQQSNKASSVVHTQKLVNNPKKLINLNRTAAAPSPPLHLTTVTRTESPKELTMVDTFVSKPVAKLVIQLGNSDSDSDVDFTALSPEKRDIMVEDPAVPVTDSVADSAIAIAKTPTVRFEEQLDKFLKSVRSKSTTTTNQEDGAAKELVEHSACGGRVAASEKSLPGTRQQQQQQQLKNAAKKLPSSSNAMATPMAVRHLSKSAQMEYMRLVARMAQLERDKLARQNSAQAPSSTIKETSVPKQDTLTVTNSSTVVEQKSTESRPGKSPGKRKQSLSIASSQLITTTTATTTSEANEEQTDATNTAQDPVERKLQQIRSSLPNLSEASRNRLLLTAEKQFEKHSGTFLGELEHHNATILEAQQARRELYHLENRIDLLKEKLALLENVYEKRKHRSYDTITSLQATRKKILFSRKRSGELERMCYQIGRTIKGETYQLPTSSSRTVVQQQLRILIAETRELRNIRKPTLQEFKEEMITNHRRRLAANADDQTEGYWKTVTYDNECDEGRSNEAEAQREGDDDAVPESAKEMRTSDTINREEASVPEEPLQEEPKNVQEQSENVVDGGAIPSAAVVNEKEEDENMSTTTEPAIVHNVMQTDDASVEEAILQEKELPKDESMPVSPGLIRSAEDTSAIEERNEEDAGIVAGETFRIEKYTSPLLSLKQGAQNIPTGILCPFELGGQCVDRDCKYEHFSQRTAA